MEETFNKLPPVLISQILSCVPVQVAARTSILSQKWRHYWKNMTTLVFEEDTFEVAGADELSELEQSYDAENQRRTMTHRCRFFYAINQVLLKHESPIFEFTLKLQTDKSCVEIDHIISYLSMKNTLKKFTLDTRGGPYDIPSCLYSLHGLTGLCLMNCTLKCQPKLDGFQNLSSLIVRNIETSKRSVLHLLSRCPSLKNLTLDTDDIEDNDNSTITNLCDCFFVVEYLSTYMLLIKHFCESGVPRVLPNTLLYLKEVRIHEMSFFVKHALPILVFIVRNCPNLEKLKIQASGEGADNPVAWLFRLEDYQDLWLRHLNVFEISNVDYDNRLVDVMRLILARSPVLKKVRLFLYWEIDEVDTMKIWEDVLSAQRASPEAELIIKKNEGWEDS